MNLNNKRDLALPTWLVQPLTVGLDWDEPNTTSRRRRFIKEKLILGQIGANASLPWILFKRDRSKCDSEFPAWNIGRVQPMMPFCCLESGGVTMRSLMPGWSFIVLEKKP